MTEKILRWLGAPNRRSISLMGERMNLEKVE